MWSNVSCRWRWPECGGRRRDGDLRAVFRRHEFLQGLAHVVELSWGAASQHGALQLLSLHLLLLLLDLLLQAPPVVAQLRQPLLQLCYLLLHGFHEHYLWSLHYVSGYFSFLYVCGTLQYKYSGWKSLFSKAKWDPKIKWNSSPLILQSSTFSTIFKYITLTRMKL